MSILKLHIRKADGDDGSAIAALMTELGYPTSVEEMQERFRKISGHPDYQTYVVELEGAIIAMTGLIKGYYYEKNGCYVRVAAFVVNKLYRGKGVGKALMRQAEQWAVQQGASCVLLNSGNREERRGAHLFYQQLGYEGKSTGFFKNIKARVAKPGS